MAKKKAITLRVSKHEIDANSYFTVDQVVNSTEFTPGDVLSEREAQILCVARDWTVKLVGDRK